MTSRLQTPEVHESVVSRDIMDCCSKVDVAVIFGVGLETKNGEGVEKAIRRIFWSWSKNFSRMTTLRALGRSTR